MLRRLSILFLQTSVEVQIPLGSDINALDVCSPSAADSDPDCQCHKRSLRWLERCKKAWVREDQALFGIVQGGMYEDLRIESAKATADMDLPGIAIGGLSVGEPKEIMYKMLEAIMPYLPKDRPRYTRK